jgi:hypothetical protein
MKVPINMPSTRGVSGRGEPCTVRGCTNPGRTRLRVRADCPRLGPLVCLECAALMLEQVPA